MENRPEIPETGAVTDEVREAYPNRFKPGQSGNPAGRPKKTEEEKTALEGIKSLAPKVPEIMESMLNNPRVAAIAKVRILEIILERTYGKPENAIKLLSARESVEASAARIMATIARVKIGEADNE